jgi:hypothetical protein
MRENITPGESMSSPSRSLAPPARCHFLLVAAALAVGLLACIEPAGAADGSPAFTFNSVEYFSRWSQGGQHEFTPRGQEDLERWTDMVTINRYTGVKDGDALAERANAVLKNYTKHQAKVLRTASVPRTADKPAEHLVAVVFGRPDFLEAAFARFQLIDGVGVSIVYSRRVYGQKVGNSMSSWLEKNGPAVEKALMDWDGIPAAILSPNAEGVSQKASANKS